MDPIVSAALTAIVATLSSPLVGGTIVALAGLTVADFVTALGAAYRHDDVEPLILAEFLRSHVLGALFPIVGLILLATFTPALTPVVGIAVTTYTVQTVASIKANVDFAAEESEDE